MKMRWNKIFAIFKKEIRELVRDKKTIFVMFALPLLIYPLLIIGVSMVMMNVQSGYETKEYVVGLDSSVDKEAVDFIKQPSEDEEGVSFKFKECDDYSEAL